MNRLVVQLRSAFRGDTILTNELQNMIIFSISRGATLDREQLAIISTTNDSLANAILQAYRQPAWSKICQGTELGSTVATSGRDRGCLIVLALMLSAALRLLSQSERGLYSGINPDSSKAALCADFKIMAAADPAALKEAVGLIS